MDAGADLIITPDAPDPFCGRCGGTAGPEGAWCDNCIRTCKEYTQQLDLQRFTELNTEPLEWAAVFYARVGIPVFPLMPGKKVPLHASALGTDRLAYAVPGDLQTLKFTFQPGVTAYTLLISKSGL